MFFLVLLTMIVVVNVVHSSRFDTQGSNVDHVRLVVHVGAVF